MAVSYTHLLNDENFEFAYDIALSPEVNVKLSKREKVPYYLITVDDEMIDKQIENMCKNNGEMVPVDEVEGTEYVKGELIELNADGSVKEGGVNNAEASLSLSLIHISIVATMTSTSSIRNLS